MTPKEFAKKIIASINPGTADISGIGDGTIKGAISEQNKNFTLNGTYIFHTIFSKELHSSNYRAYIPLLGADRYNVTAEEVSVGDKFDNVITSNSRIATSNTEISVLTAISSASGQCAYVKLSIVPK